VLCNFRRSADTPLSAFRLPLSTFSPAFSLIELLVVIAILAIMATLAIPAVGSISKANNINRGGQILGDQIVLARQEAANRNRDVEVRIINLTNGLYVGYAAVQLWIADESGTNWSPVTKMSRLPEGVLISSNPQLSPLLTNIDPTTHSTNFGSAGVRNYGGFRIRSSGVPDPSIGTNNNFLTVQPATATNGLATNYYTVRINHVTGRLSIHRP
jgi:uncharacterized protein (TIGR02596 family)